MKRRLKVTTAQQRLAETKPKTYNEENRTMEVVFSTGARVKRSTWYGDNYIEELDMSKKSIRLGRFENGAPVLDSHSRMSLKDQIGVIEGARIEKGVGIATIRFSEREEVQPIVEDIRSGIIRNVSVGYQIHKVREDQEEDGVRVFRIVDWEPTELSFVTVPADAQAQARSAEDVFEQDQECEFEFLDRSQKEEPAADEPTPAEVSERSDTEPSEDDIPDNTENRAEENSMNPKEIEEMKKKVAEDARNAERARVTVIEETIRKAGLDNSHAKRFIDEGMEIDAVRAEVIELFAKRDEETPTNAVNVQVGQDLGRDSVRSGIEGAILNRYDKSKYELDDNSGRFRNLTMVDMAKECLRAAGHSGVDLMDRKEIVRLALRGAGYHSSSDFPLALENIITKTMQRGYQEAPATWMPLAREVTVSDFKQVSRVHLGEASGLDAVAEAGEYKYGTFGERAEKYSIEKFGKIIPVTWEMIVNDDMSAFTSIPAKMGKKARDLESDKTWAILLDNTQVMAETGLALFDAGHNNLNKGAAGAISETTLSGMRAAMRSHKDLGGDSPINIFPSAIFAGTTREVEMMKQLRSITPNQSSQVNVFGQDAGFSLTPYVEPRLDIGTNPWFVSADVNSVDILEVARLAGEEAPQVFSRDGFDVDGIEFKIRHLFVAHAIDYRGLQRNDGV